MNKRTSGTESGRARGLLANIEEVERRQAMFRAQVDRKCAACGKNLPAGTAILAHDNHIFCGRTCKADGPKGGA